MPESVRDSGRVSGRDSGAPGRTRPVTMAALVKVRAATAAEVCGLYAPDPAAAALLMIEDTPADFLDRLIGKGLLGDAARFLAFALPRREAVWWACLCARTVLPAAAPARAAAALEAAEAWVYKPVEDNRRAAMACAEAAGFDSPASWAAVAAFWSAGSLAPPGAAEVPPPAHLTGTAVAAAVTMAAVQTEPQRAADKYRQFLDLGIDVAQGGSGRPKSG